MEQCQRASVKFTKQLLESIESLDYERALEVAAGDGIFTFDLLGDLYQTVDCFDQCPVAVEKLEILRRKVVAIDLVDQASMQGYEWQ